MTQVELHDGDRRFTGFEQGVLQNYRLMEEELDFIAQNHDVVVSDSWGEAGIHFEKLRQRGIPTAYDASTAPGGPKAQKALPHSTYFFFSSDDGDCRTLRELMKLLHAQGPKLVIAMLGEQGSLCFDGENFHKYGIVPCDNLVDTLGAGDSYISGFLYGIVEGLSIEECMHKGATNSTETLKYFGAW